jgi:5-methylcytosine-specific restriction endonuclease McrA
MPVQPTVPDSKACRICLVEKSLNDFSRNAASKDERRSDCRVCDNARYKIYRQENKEAIAAKQRAHRREHAERIALVTSAYRRGNAKEIAAVSKFYREQHPEKRADYGRRRRARKFGNGPAEKFTAADVLAKWGTDCHICTLPIDLDAPRHPGSTGWEMGLHLEHVQPLARGGLHNLENTKPAHGLCNLKKHATWDDGSVTFNEE